MLEVREFVPVAYRCTLSAQIFRVVNNSLKARGIFPVEKGIITAPDLHATLQDSIQGYTIANFTGVKCQEHTWDTTARGLVSENVNFVAIRVQDEYDAGL